ncbi:MAG TPA: histidine phosphatase family protein [Cyclobacteriaceae bacterium]|nr:histidine phosphatase family protein [Cyclobacteriaceae bacterium]
MSSKKIYLIRHGQTDYNKMGIVQGSGVDTSLNDYGREQARAFYEIYGKIPFDKVYTSTLRRTIESVKNFIDDGLPYESLSGLNEICWGNKEGQRITPEEDAYYHWLLEEWRRGNTSLRIEGGESPEDVISRMKPAVDHILLHPGERTILICMHGRAMRILLCHLLGEPLKNMDLYEHNNLCLYLLQYDHHRFIIELNNDLSHLKVLS